MDVKRHFIKTPGWHYKSIHTSGKKNKLLKFQSHKMHLCTKNVKE